ELVEFLAVGVGSPVVRGEPNFSCIISADLGRVSIYSGKTGAILGRQVSDAGSMLGWAVAGADNVNGDCGTGPRLRRPRGQVNRETHHLGLRGVEDFTKVGGITVLAKSNDQRFGGGQHGPCPWRWAHVRYRRYRNFCPRPSRSSIAPSRQCRDIPCNEGRA